MSPAQAHVPDVPAAAAMTDPPEHQPDPALAPDASTPVGAADAAGRPRIRDQIAENPLLSLFGAVFIAVLGFLGAVIVALLTYTLTTTQSQFAGVHDRIDRLEDKLDDGFAEQGAEIEEINLKLTALIAALNMTSEVDAALEGRLLSPDPAAHGPGSERSPRDLRPHLPKFGNVPFAATSELDTACCGITITASIPDVSRFVIPYSYDPCDLCAT